MTQQALEMNGIEEFGHHAWTYFLKLIVHGFTMFYNVLHRFWKYLARLWRAFRWRSVTRNLIRQFLVPLFKVSWRWLLWMHQTFITVSLLLIPIFCCWLLTIYHSLLPKNVKFGDRIWRAFPCLQKCTSIFRGAFGIRQWHDNVKNQLRNRLMFVLPGPNSYNKITKGCHFQECPQVIRTASAQNTS